MAEELKQTAILTFEVDQAGALEETVKMRKAITQTKEEQKELTDAYKKGVITIDEYADESVRLEAILKKEQATYKNVSKAVQTQSNSINALTASTKKLKDERNNLDLTSAKGLKRLDELNKMIDKNDKALQKNVSLLEKQKINIGNYASAIDLLVPGTANLVGQVQGLSTAFIQSGKAVTATGFSLKTLNAIPVLALISGLIGVFNLLSIAAKGASDEIYKGFTFIQDQENAIKRLSKEVDNYIDSLSAQNDLLSAIGKNEQDILTNQQNANIFQQAAQKSRIDLIKQELLLIKQRQSLDMTAEAFVQKFGADTFNRQISLTRAIDESGKSEEEYLKLKIEELETEQKALILLQNQNTVIGVKLTNQRVADAEEAKREAERLDALREEFRLLQLVARQGGRNVDVSGINADKLGLATADKVDITPDGSTPEEEKRTKDLIEGNAQLQLNVREKLNADLLKLDQKAGIEEIKNKNAVAQAKIAADEATLKATAQIAGEASELFEESTGAYKVLASAQTLISTYLSAQKAFESLVGTSPVGFALGAAAAAVAIAQGLKRVASINGVEFFEGGYTGAGPIRQSAGVVHKDEYVTPSKVLNNPAAAQHIGALERMRTGYFDGGFTTTSNTAQAQQSLMMMNAIRMLPPPVVGVREITTVQNRIDVRERQSKR